MGFYFIFGDGYLFWGEEEVLFDMTCLWLKKVLSQVKYTRVDAVGIATPFEYSFEYVSTDFDLFDIGLSQAPFTYACMQHIICFVLPRTVHVLLISGFLG